MPDDRAKRTDASLGRMLGVLVAAFGLFATGCQTFSKIQDKTYNSMRSLITSSYHDPDPEGKMAKAQALFEQQQYKQAQAIFGDVADNTYNPVLLAEQARYMEAECLRLEGKLFEAEAHYNRMLKDFPAGAYRERACGRMYDIAYGWLKESTLNQIERESSGVQVAWWEKMPGLPNFLDNSKPMLDQEGEALKYLESVHTHDLTGPTADKSLFWCGYVHFYRGRYEEADHFFSQLVELHKDSPLWNEALKLAVIAKNNSTGGSVYDTTKASEALQLVHHAEATVPEYAKNPDKGAWLTRQKMAVRMQLAEKDFKTAQYYERTLHPASAYFYYELVTRRYPGTKYAEESLVRLEALKVVKAQVDADRAAGRPTTTWEAVQQEWNKVTGKPNEPKPETALDKSEPTGPIGTPPPQPLPGDLGGPR